jgi:hypothetical protein
MTNWFSAPPIFLPIKRNTDKGSGKELLRIASGDIEMVRMRPKPDILQPNRVRIGGRLQVFARPEEKKESNPH